MQNDLRKSDAPTAHGDVRSPGGASVGTARFAWSDPESGERLVVELRGSAAFLAALEASGFQRLPEDGTGAPRGSGGGSTAHGGGPDRPRAGEPELPRLAIVTPLLRGSA